jgi:hypothetical protein
MARAREGSGSRGRVWRGSGSLGSGVGVCSRGPGRSGAEAGSVAGQSEVRGAISTLGQVRVLGIGVTLAEAAESPFPARAEPFVSQTLRRCRGL